MRVNVWGINYWPELTGIAVYNTEMCEYLADASWQVTIVTAFPYYPLWRRRPSDRSAIYREDRIGSVHVMRCWQFVPSRPSAKTRMVHEASFVLTSFLKQLTLPAPDIYVVVSPPLLLGIAAWLISLIKRAPYHFHIQDLQPDAAVSLTLLKKGWFTNLLYWLELLAYEKAASVSAISPQMCEAIAQKGINSEKIIHFPNWIDTESSDQLVGSGVWKQSRGIDPARPVISYAGNLGLKQGLDLVIEAARLLNGKYPILFVIAGDGAQRVRLHKLKQEYNLDNVLMEDVLPPLEHSALLIDSEICLIPQRPGAGEPFLPSKLLKTLALKRPVLTNADPGGALHQAVCQGQFGLCVAGSDPESFAQAIVNLLGDEKTRATMGEAGRKYVMQFHSDKVLADFKEHLQAVSSRQNSCE